MNENEAAKAQTRFDELRKQSFRVATNSGTYGADEACRKIGTGDPQFADCTIYRMADGRQWHVGCDPKRAPGRLRYSLDEYNAAHAELRKLRLALNEYHRELRRQRRGKAA